MSVICLTHIHTNRNTQKIPISLHLSYSCLFLLTSALTLFLLLLCNFHLFKLNIFGIRKMPLSNEGQYILQISYVQWWLMEYLWRECRSEVMSTMFIVNRLSAPSKCTNTCQLLGRLRCFANPLTHLHVSQQSQLT